MSFFTNIHKDKKILHIISKKMVYEFKRKNKLLLEDFRNVATTSCYLT